MDKVRELIAAMKSDRFNGDMALEVLDLLTNEVPTAPTPAISEALQAAADHMREVQRRLEASKVKIESLESRVKSLEEAWSKEQGARSLATKDDEKVRFTTDADEKKPKLKRRTR